MIPLSTIDRHADGSKGLTGCLCIQQGRDPVTTQCAKQPSRKQTKGKTASEKKQSRRSRQSAALARQWTAFKISGDHDIRQELLKRYMPLVRNVASRMAMGFPKSVELSDLISTGSIGLIEALHNFDPDRGVKFETFAVPRIRGAILDELRSLDWVPRSTRAKARQIDRATMKLENRLGRVPSRDELAKTLRVTADELAGMLSDVTGTTLLSLDELVYREEDNRQVPRVETLESKAHGHILGELERQEVRAYLVDSINHLTEQEKLVIALYYYEELTLKEIGEIMHISESRVSQIHTKAVTKLRGLIKERFGN